MFSASYKCFLAEEERKEVLFIAVGNLVLDSLAAHASQTDDTLWHLRAFGEALKLNITSGGVGLPFDT